ncbi:MAG: polysaccharide deacetylase family protein, partial [Lacipirellulaceae bacterium]
MLPNACKEPILGMYYLATLPGRRQAASRRAAEKRAPITTLFYHRVADDHPNDWTIGFERFQAHIEWIRERFEIITLTEAQHRIGSEENRTPAVCITFDDGYADNSREALPWLLDEKVPFTYFVSTDHIAEGKPFAHDEEAGVPLAPN